eukprot:6314999-Alexandrium_andersonii.AAC.1
MLRGHPWWMEAARVYPPPMVVAEALCVVSLSRKPCHARKTPKGTPALPATNIMTWRLSASRHFGMSVAVPE